MIDKTQGLISLADAKRYLNISTDNTNKDRLLDAIIMQASVLIQKELGYNLISQSYTEYYSGNGSKNIWLENIPITEVEKACIGRHDVLTISNTGGAARATIQITANDVKLKSIADGVESSSTLSISDYATISTMATAISAVSGWEATAATNYTDYPAADLLQVPGQSAADSATVYLAIPQASEDDYEVYPDEGRLYNPYCWSSGYRNIIIKYTAGYAREDIPEPIQSAVMELVSIVYNLSQKDESLRSEKIGDYSYTVADRVGAIFSASGQEGVSNMVMMKLTPYRRNLVYGA